MFKDEVYRLYGGRLRTRVCGVHIVGGKILMVSHKGAREGMNFWAPPGGSVHFGEPLVSALEREFLEETSLRVRVGSLLFVHEFLEPPLHAVELFFEIEEVCGRLQSGYDPEMSVQDQIIDGVEYMSISEIHRLPAGSFHGFFSKCSHVNDVLKFRGYIAGSE